MVAGNGAADVAPGRDPRTDEVAPVAAAEVPDDGGPPFTKGRPLGRFRARSPKAAGTAESALAAAAVAAAVGPPAPRRSRPCPWPAHPRCRRRRRPVVTRVFEPPPTTPLIPVIVPVDPSGELVARKVTAPPTAVPLDVPADPEPTITVPLGRRSGSPSVTFQRRRTRPRVRRVTRVVRHVDTWSVFKVARGLQRRSCTRVTLTAGVLLWNVAIATGTIDNVERFFEALRLGQRSSSRAARSTTTPGSPDCSSPSASPAWPCSLATLFNLITDLVGGIRVSVLEEEVVARRDRTARIGRSRTTPTPTAPPVTTRPVVASAVEVAVSPIAWPDCYAGL